MADLIHLIVVKGEEKGREVAIPPEGARLGRSSKNDIVVEDPMLSRHHCRLFFKTGDGLWITDLGSANHTAVNGKDVQELKLAVGDIIGVGDTDMRVVHDSLVAPAAAPLVDLGLLEDGKKAKGVSTGRMPLMKPLVLIGAVMLVLLAVVWVPKFMRQASEVQEGGGGVTPLRAKEPSTLEISYEKITASPNNIFRYHVDLKQDGSVRVSIDDIRNGYRQRKTERLSKEYTRELMQMVDESKFFKLRPRYVGGANENGSEEVLDLAVTVGYTTHRVLVRNQREPQAFQKLREKLETSIQHQLGLMPAPHSPEELTRMAKDAYAEGMKLQEQEVVDIANLYNSIKRYELALWYLDYVTPKPSFYKDILARQAKAEDKLEKRYKDIDFRAIQAARMKEWGEAVRQLRIVIEMIPNTEDERYKNARKRLLEAEGRLKLQG